MMPVMALIVDVVVVWLLFDVLIVADLVVMRWLRDRRDRVERDG